MSDGVTRSGQAGNTRSARPASDTTRPSAGVAASPAPTTASSGSQLSPAFLHQLERMSLVSLRRLATHGQGDRRSTQRGSSLQFADFRSYAPGDDLRQVDWNVYGRSGELLVRLYEDERTLGVHLLVDVSRSMDWGMPNKRQVAISLASALAYVTLSGFDRLQLGFLGDRLVGQAGPFWGQQQRAAALAALASPPRAGSTDFVASISSYLDRLHQPGLFVLITDLLSPTAEDGLRRLISPRHEAIVIHLLAPQELAPEPGEDVQLVDRETGQAIDVTLDLATLARYRERLDAWSERLSRLCRERNARYVRLSSGDDLERRMIGALRRQRILQ